MVWLPLICKKQISNKSQKLFVEITDKCSLGELKQILIETYHFTPHLQFLYDDVSISEAQYYHPISELHVFKGKDLNSISILVLDQDNQNESAGLKGPVDLTQHVIFGMDPAIKLTNNGRSATTSFSDAGRPSTSSNIKF